MMKKKGYVYILSNDAYQEEYYKIGMTTRSADARASELYKKNTAVPGKFSVEFTIKVSDCALAEQRIHFQLSMFRVNNNREFFKVPISKARQVIIEVCEKIDPPPQKNIIKKTKSTSSTASFYRAKELDEKHIRNRAEAKKKLRLAAAKPNPTPTESLPKHTQIQRQVKEKSQQREKQSEHITKYSKPSLSRDKWYWPLNETWFQVGWGIIGLISLYVLFG